jgi:hypothetical protein
MTEPRKIAFFDSPRGKKELRITTDGGEVVIRVGVPDGDKTMTTVEVSPALTHRLDPAEWEDLIEVQIRRK